MKNALKLPKSKLGEALATVVKTRIINTTNNLRKIDDEFATWENASKNFRIIDFSEEQAGKFILALGSKLKMTQGNKTLRIVGVDEIYDHHRSTSPSTRRWHGLPLQTGRWWNWSVDANWKKLVRQFNSLWKTWKVQRTKRFCFNFLAI